MYDPFLHRLLPHQDWGDADELGRNNHDTVAAINAALKNRGLNTWFDSDRLVSAPWKDKDPETVPSTCLT